MSLDMFPDWVIEQAIKDGEIKMADMGQHDGQEHKQYDPAQNNGIEMTLGEECGHHCGVITTGKHAHTGHCPCRECHGDKKSVTRLISSTANQEINSRGIR